MPQDGSCSKLNPCLTWFGNIQSDIANRTAGLANSKALAQQAASISASIKLDANPYIDFKNTAAIQALNRVQSSANTSSAFLDIRNEQSFKAVDAMRQGMVMEIDSPTWKQITGAQTSIAALAKVSSPLSDLSTLAGMGQVIPPKSTLARLNFSAVTEAITATQALSRQAMVPRGLSKAIAQATKGLTVSEQLLKQMKGLAFSPAAQVALKEYSTAFPDFEKFSAVSKIVGEHYSQPNINSTLRRFRSLERELKLDIPVETPGDIDDLIDDAETVEYVQNQITEDGALKPSISQALFGFNLNELTLTQSGSLVAFGGSVITYLHQALGTLLEENVTAARFFTVAIIYFIPVYGAAMAADGALSKGKDSPAA